MWARNQGNCTVVPDFDNIRLSKNQLRSAGGGKRRTPDMDAIAYTLALRIAADMAHEAAKRLRKLLDWRGSATERLCLELISINAGKGNMLLNHLVEADMNMIGGNKDKISSTLNDELLKCVPLPDATELVEGESPQEKLNAEVSRFVNTYIQLLSFSYCEIPRLSGRPPSAFVPKYSPFGEVTNHEHRILGEDPVMIHNVTRLQVKDERDRLVRSRELVAPGPQSIRYFIATVSTILFWICVVAVRPFSFYDIPGLRYAIGLALTISALSQSFKMFGKFCHLSVDRDESSSQYCWKVASHCTEIFQRTTAVRLGRPTPYDQKMSELRDTCVSMHSTWRMRIARRNFQAALRRKRITNKESVLLLTEMADRFFETDDEEAIEGVFQAELNEVEEFLKLQVEEGVSCTEVTLSPDAAVKNYLNLDSDEDETNEEDSSPFAQLCNLGGIVEECVLFGEGDRVKVQIGEEGLQVTASVVFSTASLVYVHIDGVPAESPTAIPIHQCSILVEHLPLLEDTEVLDKLVEDVSSSSDSDSSVATDMNMSEDYDDDNNDKEDSEEVPRVPQSQAKIRARTVEEALIDGGWVLTRAKKHIKYSRRVKLSKDGPAQKQTVTLSKTPSDWRAERNKLSLLRRLNNEVMDEMEANIDSSDDEEEVEAQTIPTPKPKAKTRARRRQRKRRAR